MLTPVIPLKLVFAGEFVSMLFSSSSLESKEEIKYNAIVLQLEKKIP